MFSILTGEDSIKCFDPSNPFSSASNPTNKTLRLRLLILEDSFCASSSNPAVPDALSSAPG